MSLIGYTRLRLNWGGLDITIAQQQTPAYGATQIVSGGDSAAIGDGIGVRRAVMVVDRKAAVTGADDATFHFDFLNMTGGSPDDTWISTDYTNLETALVAFWTSYKANVDAGYGLREIRWYRVGTGVSPPNPAERIYILPSISPGTWSSSYHAPQVASTITFRTGSRRHWGRTYLPYSGSVTSTHKLSTTVVDNICGWANTLLTSAASNDMYMVVVCDSINSSLNVEHVEVDDVMDIVRRRRWSQSTYKKIIP